MKNSIALNRTISHYFGKSLGLFSQKNYFAHADNIYNRLLKKYITQLKDAKPREPLHILDIGCGMTTFLERIDKKENNYMLYGLDISREDIGKNNFVDHKIIFDACNADFEKHLKNYKGMFDLVCSHSFLEHVKKPEITHRLVNYLLKDGGVAIHRYPTLYDPTLVIGHILPEPIAARVLFLMEPFRKKTGKFKTYYTWCRRCGNNVRRNFLSTGFTVIESYDLYGTFYLYSFFPLQLVLDIFYRIVMLFKISFFTSHSIVVLNKKG